jgi:UDP-perosamine 4-acetyltransferase
MDPRPAAEALVIYGCGTQGQAILELAKQVQGFCELRGADDNPDLWGRELLSVAVQQPASALAEGPHRFLVAIGDNRVRQSLFETIRAAGHRPATVCHPSAQVAGSASLGEGNMLMARVVVNTLARIGDGCLLNTASVVEHHCQIGSFVHLAPGVLLGGGVHIGDRAFLGLGAIVLPGIRVGADAIVGAGAVVLRDVPAGAVVAGNPARPLARSRPLLSPSA